MLTVLPVPRHPPCCEFDFLEVPQVAARMVKIKKVGGPKLADLPDVQAFAVKNGDVVEVPTEMAHNLVDGGFWERVVDEPKAKAEAEPAKVEEK